jgi:hypothetical protein
MHARWTLGPYDVFKSGLNSDAIIFLDCRLGALRSGRLSTLLRTCRLLAPANTISFGEPPSSYGSDL